MTFAYPILLFMPLIFLVIPLFKKRKRLEQAITVASADGFRDGVTWKVRLRKPVLRLLLLATVLLLALAAARPQTITNLPQPEKKRNLMLVLDVSGSMQTPDFFLGFRQLSRLDAVRHVVSSFIQDRIGDRIGLVVFGSKAHLECPLTTDSSLLSQMVKSLYQGMVGNSTAIGDGMGVALKHIKDVPAEASSLILLTDGVTTAGNVQPLQAAKVAADLGIKVHTIGIGRASGESGAEFDEATLKEVAAKTGGEYFNASNLEQLKSVYDQIDKLEQSERDAPAVERIEEHFQVFAAWALVALTSLLLLSRTIFMVLPL
jgi:Ca-activated chloride channel homolog